MRKFFLYRVPTALLLFPMVGSAIYYLVDTPAVIEIFGQMGYPAYTVYFNAFAKILGGIAIAFPFPRVLKEFAYAGYLYIMLLALQAVWMTMPGIPWMMFVFLILWAVAYRQYQAVQSVRSQGLTSMDLLRRCLSQVWIAVQIG